MGWLGWTPEVALAADVNLIEMALSSRSDLLKTIFGSGEKEKPKGKLTARGFKAFAARHNGKKRSGK
jgi:hypothetical protein